MRKVALRSLRAHKGRVAMTVAAVALGVAFMAGVMVLTDTMQKSFDDLFETVYDGTDAVVRSEETLDTGDFGMPDARASLDEAVLEDVRSVDTVDLASGELEGFGTLLDADGEALSTAFGGPTLVVSIDTSAQDTADQISAWEEVSTIEIREGRWAEADDEIVLDVDTFQRLGFDVGDVIPLQTETGLYEYTLVGTITFGGQDSAAGQSILALTTAEAQQALGREGQLDTISVAATEGVSEEQVAEDIRAAVGDGVEVITGEQAEQEIKDEITEFVDVLSVALGGFAAVALGVGAFVIYNSFSIIVAQRTREMALLRAIGASRRQVRRVVVVEAVATGLVGSLIGLLIGLVLAAGLAAMFAIEGDLAILVPSVLTALVVGTAVTVASSLVPARRAGRVPPVAAMREVAIDRAGRSVVRMVIGAVVTLAGLALGVAGATGHALGPVGAGVVLGFLGVFLVAPALARPAGRVLGWPLARFRGVSGNLARNNAARNPRRTAATGLALTIGIGLVAFFLVVHASVQASFEKVVDENFRGDFIVEGGGGGFMGVSPELAPEIAGIDAVDRVTSARFSSAAVDGEGTFVLGASPSVFDSFGFSTDGSVGLERGEVVVRTEAAESEGLAVGDQVTMEFLDGAESATLTVSGFYEESPGLDLGDYVVGIEELEAHTTATSDNMVVIDLVDGADADAVREEISAALTTYAPAAEVQDNEDFKETIRSQVDALLLVILALLVLAIIIAAFGIANTIALSTMERTRELGLLRSVGMTRAQLRSMVRNESAVIAVFGAGLGLAVGVLGGWGLVTALADQGFEVFRLPVFYLAVLVLVAGLLGIMAASVPAWRAGRMDVLRAIHTE